jgi:hypothetical protein
MTPIRKPLPGAKPDLAKKVEGFKNRVTSMIRGGPKSVPTQTAAVTPSGKPMANDSFIQAIAAGPQPNPLSGAKMGGLGFKKGGSVSSASKRADGIAVKGKTRGKIC